MEIGFPNNPRKNLIKEINWIAKHGFDFVDLFLEEDKASKNKINVPEVKKVIKKYGLGTVGHTAWYLPIGSPIESLRNAAIKEIKDYLEIFSKLEVEYVTVHSDWFLGLFNIKECIKFQVESLKKICEDAKDYGIKIMLEMSDNKANTINNISNILKEVKGLYLHLDLGHLNLMVDKPEDYIKRFKSKLRHVHLHDNYAEKDLHLPIGCGNLELEKILKVLKKYYDRTITLEVFSKDRDYALLAKEKLRKLWNKL